MASVDSPKSEAVLERIRGRLRQLYHGRSPVALRFQIAVTVVDLLIIAFFIATPVLRDVSAFLWIDYSVAVIVTLEIAARFLASSNMPRLMRQPAILLDLFILATLLAPQWLENFGFLRILRLWSLSQKGFIWAQLRTTRYHEWENVARALINILTFLFVVTGFVFTFFFREAGGLASGARLADHRLGRIERRDGCGMGRDSGRDDARPASHVEHRALHRVPQCRNESLAGFFVGLHRPSIEGLGLPPEFIAHGFQIGHLILQPWGEVPRTGAIRQARVDAHAAR